MEQSCLLIGRTACKLPELWSATWLVPQPRDAGPKPDQQHWAEGDPENSQQHQL